MKRKSIHLSKIALWMFVFLLAACSGGKNDVVTLVPNIPTAVPGITPDAKLNVRNFKTLVEVEYKGDSVLLSQLPQGVTASVKGANVAVYSNIPGVEVSLKGSTRNGSLHITANEPLLLSMNSVALFSKSKNAITVVAPKGVYLRGVGEKPNYILDACKSEGEYVSKNSAAIRIEGSVVLSGGNIAVKSERMNAIHCSGKMLIDSINIVVEKAAVDAIVADSGIVVAGGNIAVTEARDAFKSKRGNLVVLGGNINVEGSREKGDGVQVRNFYLYGGNVDIKTSGAAARGVNSKGALYLMDGLLNVSTSGEAIFSPKKADYISASCLKSATHTYIGNACVVLENSAEGGKGINCDGMMQIDGGILSIINRGNDIQHPQEIEAHSSAKGIKCDSSLLVKGGVIDIRVFGKGERCEGLEAKGRMILAGNVAMNIFAYDDAINAGDDLVIEGGRIFAYSVANDGIDGNAKISIKGGIVVATGAHAPEQGVDTDGDARFDITGGTLVAMGGSMGPSPTMPRSHLTTQPFFACSGRELVRGKYMALCSADGAVLYAYKLPRSMRGGALSFSTPELALGGSYSLLMCDTVVGARNLGNGLLEGGTATGNAVCSWVQEKLLALVSFNGVTFIDKLAEGDNGGQRMPPPPSHQHIDNEGYGEGDIPGGGWAPVR